MPYSYGWRHDLEDRRWLRANQTRFDAKRFRAAPIPNEIDLRPHITIKNQQELGACSGFSRSTLEECLNGIATSWASKLTLSAMFAYLTNQKECGCFGADNGATIAGSVQAATNEGICEESLFPYTGQYTTTIPDAATSEGRLHLIKSHSEIASYDAAVQYLGTAGVIQIGVPVGNAFQSCTGPLTAQMVQADARKPEGGHALAVVGYLKPETIGAPQGDGRAWLLGVNSWDTDWGASGFFFIEPRAWDYWAKMLQRGSNQVEIDGMSGIEDFADAAAQPIDWTGIFS